MEERKKNRYFINMCGIDSVVRRRGSEGSMWILYRMDSGFGLNACVAGNCGEFVIIMSLCSERWAARLGQSEPYLLVTNSAAGH